MFEEVLPFLSGQPLTVVILVIQGIILYQHSNIVKSLRVLNHNSSSIVKALLARKVLRPEDVQDVEV